jgi:redox-sensitive bicupin YhaK (pirin superfamily)
MTAGRGIVHSEFPQQVEGLMWGFQLWVNLPATDKMTAPRYQDIQADQVPETTLAPGVRARVLTGKLGGVEGPVTGVATEPIYYDLHLDKGRSYDVPLPTGHNAFVYVYAGNAVVGAGSTALERGELALLGSGDSVRVAAGADDCRLILVAARPLNEPIARYGPFVMNTREELEQAFRDYQTGRMGRIES